MENVLPPEKRSEKNIILSLKPSWGLEKVARPLREIIVEHIRQRFREDPSGHDLETAEQIMANLETGKAKISELAKTDFAINYKTGAFGPKWYALINNQGQKWLIIIGPAEGSFFNRANNSKKIPNKIQARRIDPSEWESETETISRYLKKNFYQPEETQEDYSGFSLIELLKGKKLEFVPGPAY